LEAQRSARDFLRNAARKKIVVKQFQTSFFPFEGEKIKQFFETLKSFHPDLVFTHYRDDRHQDHRVLSDLSCMPLFLKVDVGCRRRFSVWAAAADCLRTQCH
jgi:LmbE family N-acetylglucosaminyl deacetylase